EDGECLRRVRRAGLDPPPVGAGGSREQVARGVAAGGDGRVSGARAEVDDPRPAREGATWPGAIAGAGGGRDAGARPLRGGGARCDRGRAAAPGRTRGGPRRGRAVYRALCVGARGPADGAPPRARSSLLRRDHVGRLRRAGSPAAVIGRTRRVVKPDELAIWGGAPAVRTPYRERWRQIRRRDLMPILAHAWRDVSTLPHRHG